MNFKSKSVSPKPFVRNEQFCKHYRSIGNALLTYENEAPFLLRNIDAAAMANLRVAISFLPDAMLDSYLEDLLDLGISDRDLFVVISNFSLRRLSIVVPLSGLILAIGLGFYLSSLELPYSFCVAAIVGCSIPFALLWEWVPRSSNRRLFFARLIASQLSNRRGQKNTSPTEEFEIKEALVPSMGRVGN